MQRRLVDLAERGAGDGAGADGGEERRAVRLGALRRAHPRRDRPSPLQLFGQQPHRFGVVKRLVCGLQRLELLADLLVEDVGPLREGLTELDRHRPEHRQLLSQPDTASLGVVRLAAPRVADRDGSPRELNQPPAKLERPQREETLQRGAVVGAAQLLVCGVPSCTHACSRGGGRSGASGFRRRRDAGSGVRGAARRGAAALKREDRMD
mmetsp:Transcript_2591/g.7965  ORF Transcript_2591/g.7965 Transcript_2591/m.7965 type:complete len:209 (+) Transcript_2591:427-1053(+)